MTQILSDLTEEQKQSIKNRRNCPFYNFIRLVGLSLDEGESGSKNCGLIGSECKCDMLIPNFKHCKHNTNENISNLKTQKIFPEELIPHNEGGWSGITVENWLEIFEKIKK